MLLIDPPFECLSDSHSAYAKAEFRKFQRTYEQKVLDLPFPTLNRVLRYLNRDFHGRPMTAAILHQVVERELSDVDAEASGKVARLVILGAFARSLEDLGVSVMESTKVLLSLCERQVPTYLKLAIADHLGIVPAENP